MPKNKIIFEAVYETDPEKSQQAMDAAFTYLSHIADEEGWFDEILKKK